MRSALLTRGRCLGLGEGWTLGLSLADTGADKTILSLSDPARSQSFITADGMAPPMPQQQPAYPYQHDNISSGNEESPYPQSLASHSSPPYQGPNGQDPNQSYHLASNNTLNAHNPNQQPSNHGHSVSLSSAQLFNTDTSAGQQAPQAAREHTASISGPSSLGPTAGPAGGTWSIPPRPKPGRKPMEKTEDPHNRRKVQNRHAQRAFRDRRARKVQEMEEQMQETKQQYEDENARLTIQLHETKQLLSAAKDELTVWRQHAEKLQADLDRERKSKGKFNLIQYHSISRKTWLISFTAPTLSNTILSTLHGSGNGHSVRAYSVRSSELSLMVSSTLMKPPPRHRYPPLRKIERSTSPTTSAAATTPSPTLVTAMP